MGQKIVDFNTLSTSEQDLIKSANTARNLAYCPYSGFAVGAALLTSIGSKIYTGCNVESATFTPSICAERTAVCKAVSEGYRSFKAVAVLAFQPDQFTAPCGVCRQVLVEFGDKTYDMDIFICKPQMDKVLRLKLSELLPFAFVSYKDHNRITDNGNE